MTSRKTPKKKFRSIELFTGAGGLALGTHLAGFHHEALIEWERNACETLRWNARNNSISGTHDWNVIQGDVRSVDFKQFGDIDLVAGGPPCQPFSLGGKHKGRLDPRDMFPQFIRAVRELQPKAFILENVKGLTRAAFSTYLEYIKLQLTFPSITAPHDLDWEEHLSKLKKHQVCAHMTDLSYDLYMTLVNAADYGVPQVRHRVLIIGFRRDVRASWEFPIGQHTDQRLKFEQLVSGEYWKRHKLRKPRIETSSRFPSVEQVGLSLPWKTLRDAIGDLPAPNSKAERGEIINHALQLGAKSYPGHTGSPIDWPSKTLKAGVHGVPGGENTVLFPDGSLRYLTVREAARVQTFPDTWRFLGSWTETMRQLGNAVPVVLAQNIAKAVHERLVIADEGRTSLRPARIRELNSETDSI